MEYDYMHDTITGASKAIFSTEHSVMGPWLEVEVGHDTQKLEDLLVAIDAVGNHDKPEVLITGHEYSVMLNKQDVNVCANASLNGVEALPEELLEEQVDFDQTASSQCGLDDFRKALLDWAKFTQK